MQRSTRRSWLAFAASVAGAAALAVGCGEIQEDASSASARGLAGAGDGGDAGHIPLVVRDTDTIEVAVRGYPPSSTCRVQEADHLVVRAELATRTVTESSEVVVECSPDAGNSGVGTQPVRTEPRSRSVVVGDADLAAIRAAVDDVSLLRTNECVCCDGTSYRITITHANGEREWYGDGVMNNCSPGVRAENLGTIFRVLSDLAHR